VKMPSGEIRRIHENCFATIGQVGNVDHMNVASGKAVRTDGRDAVPHVRGMVMNPIDHPMGGGQGKSKGGGGRHHPVSPWDNSPKDLKRGANASRVTASFWSASAGRRKFDFYGKITKERTLRRIASSGEDRQDERLGLEKAIKTWSRRSMVTPDFVGHTFLVHNGKIFNSVFHHREHGRS